MNNYHQRVLLSLQPSYYSQLNIWFQSFVQINNVLFPLIWLFPTCTPFWKLDRCKLGVRYCLKNWTTITCGRALTWIFHFDRNRRNPQLFLNSRENLTLFIVCEWTVLWAKGKIVTSLFSIEPLWKLRAITLLSMNNEILAGSIYPLRGSVHTPHQTWARVWPRGVWPKNVILSSACLKEFLATTWRKRFFSAKFHFI